MNYDLFRGPAPRLRTFDEFWLDVLREKWLRDHYMVSKPVFIGRMPQRVDLEIEPLQQPSDRLGFQGWMTVGPVIYWVRPKWWHPVWRLWKRIKRALGLEPKPNTEMRLI